LVVLWHVTCNFTNEFDLFPIHSLCYDRHLFDKCSTFPTMEHLAKLSCLVVSRHIPIIICDNPASNVYLVITDIQDHGPCSLISNQNVSCESFSHIHKIFGSLGEL
jgi:hypothetical protein